MAARESCRKPRGFPENSPQSFGHPRPVLDGDDRSSRAPGPQVGTAPAGRASGDRGPALDRRGSRPRGLSPFDLRDRIYRDTAALPCGIPVQTPLRLAGRQICIRACKAEAFSLAPSFDFDGHLVFKARSDQQSIDITASAREMESVITRFNHVILNGFHPAPGDVFNPSVVVTRPPTPRIHQDSHDVAEDSDRHVEPPSRHGYAWRLGGIDVTDEGKAQRQCRLHWMPSGAIGESDWGPGGDRRARGMTIPRSSYLPVSFLHTIRNGS